MKVSMDGMRRNIARAFADVHEALCDEFEGYATGEGEVTNDAMIKLRSMIGAAMCVYSENPDDLFNNLEPEIDFILPSFEKIEGGVK